MKLLCLALLVLVAHQAQTKLTTRVKHQRSILNPVPKENIKVNLRKIGDNPEGTTENLKATTRKPWFKEPRHERIDSRNLHTDHNQLNHCKEGEFQCDADLCVSEEKRCDGRVNCKDGTDEDDCVNLRIIRNPEATTENLEATTKNPWFKEPRHEIFDFRLTYTDHNQLNRCKEGEFQCDVDLCVSEEKRCDGRVNCKDGTDEDDCDQEEKHMGAKRERTRQGDSFIGPLDNIWNNDECRYIRRFDGQSLSDCKSRCSESTDCTAINFAEDFDCVLRACDLPVPDPQWHLIPYHGYKIVKGSCSTFTHATGTINYPSGGDNYPNYADLCWVINAGTPIRITFTRFQVETNYDFLTIRDGSSSDSGVIAKLSGHTLPPPVETSGNAANLQFTSDYSVTFTGFELHWAPSDCGETYTTSNGQIRHPSNGGNYENDEDCVWKINAAEPIKITFVSFDLESNYDFLYVRNGPSSDSPLLGRFTRDTNPNPVQTTQNSAFIRFTSDYSVTKTGFWLRWEAASTTTGPSDCACGQVNRASRIVNGIETDVNEYPWQAAMVSSGTSSVFCGASVIGSKHVLTAAHCTQAVTAYGLNYQVLVGAHRLSSAATSQIRLEAARFIQHPDYDASTQDNDISIIELSSSIDFGSSEIRPVCLPSSDDNSYDSVTATVTGWGRLEHGGAQPDVLMEVDVPTMSNTKCSTFYSGGITENMLCAGYDEGGKDSCQGDSGGALYYNPGAGYIQIGVVSWGYGCALPGNPGVYARITRYLTWISDNSASGTTCSAAKHLT